MAENIEISGKKKLLFSVVLCLLPILLLVLAEISGRAVVFFLYGHPGKSYGIYESDPVLGHFPAPNTYNHLTALNDYAFRNAENVIEPKPKGALRIIAYGGSTTFSYNLGTEESWPYKLERRMREGLGNPAHQVLNGGGVIWSLSHLLERTRRELPVLKPDMVLIYSGINEESNTIFLKKEGRNIHDLVTAGHYGAAAVNYPQSSWLHLNSLTFKALRKVMASLGLARLFAGGEEDGIGLRGTVDPSILKNYIEVLKRFIALARSNGAEPVFVIQASREYKFITDYSRKGADTACGLGVRVVDAALAVDANPGGPGELFETNIHYSAKGADVLAEYLFERVFRNPTYSACP